MTNVNPGNKRFPRDDRDAYDSRDNYEDVDNPDRSSTAASAAASGGLPLRGFAMVLIAVALLLGLWGLYALTQGDGDDTAANSSNGAATQQNDASNQAGLPQPGQPGAPGQAGQNPTGDSGAARNPLPTPGEQAAPTPGDASAPGDRDNTQGTAPAPGRAAAPGVGSAANAQPRLNVLNNSTVSGLAESVYKKLKDDGNQMGVQGNLPGKDVTLPVTTVFYQPGDAAGERAARELAERLARTNGVQVDTAPNDKALPAEATGPGNITLALIGDLNV